MREEWEFIRQRVRAYSARTELGALYTALYQGREELVRHCFPETEPLVPPLISLEADSDAWRGRYASTGAFGLDDVITLNVRRLPDAETMWRTLAHELAHWFVQEQGHTQYWSDTFFERCGVACNSKGEWLRDTGKWWDISSELPDLSFVTWPT